MIWHQAKHDTEVLRQGFASQRELLIEYNRPQLEVSVIYGLRLQGETEHRDEGYFARSSL